MQRYKKAKELIDKSGHIVIASHLNPDGDTIGSMIGLGEVLKKIGKKVSYFNIEKKLPKKFDFLCSYKKIKSSLPDRFDLFISVDAASFDRLGIDKSILTPMICFDHHKSNTGFADINFIDHKKVSTSLVVLEFLEFCKYDIPKQSAEALYLALLEDSGFFKFDRVDEETFNKAALLVKLGANPSKIANMLTNRNSLAKLRLTKIYLDKLTLLNNATICISKLTLEDFKKSGALKSDSDEFVNIGLSLATVKLSIFIYEVDLKNIKVSLRSKSDDIDCSKIAIKYDGGGHKRAAGFTADLKDIDGIIRDIIISIKKGKK